MNDDQPVDYGPTRSSDVPLRSSPETHGAAGASSQPQFIGSYRVVRLLGEGGMGVVWEAEQASPRRNVAVKVIRQGRYVDELTARLFRREAESLGRLKHPNIAAIYEAGRTEDGHDYFAMELVRGQTLGEWLDSRQGPLTPKEITLQLRILALIAETVNYAHQRGVIHRDLKPSNIVLAAPEREGQEVALPVVKILDFGLARVLAEGDDLGEAGFTRDGTVRGTLAYMSPEQARGDVHAIDVRTDVCALGVILFEMLAGRRPHDLSKMTFVDAVRTVTTKPAPRLSEHWRGTRRLDRDLETIAARALEIEPDRRYASAGALARDIERYLGSLPIVARPPSRTYRARMFVRRHRAGVGAAAAIVLLLVAGIIGTTIGLVSALRANRSAAARAADLETVVDFEAAQLSKVDVPRMGLGIRDDLIADLKTGLTRAHVPAAESDSTVATFERALARTNATSIALGALDRSIFDATLKAIDAQFKSQPLVKARLLQVQAEVLRDVGLVDKADAPQAEALRIRRTLLGDDARDTIESVAKTIELVGAGHSRHHEAETLARPALERARRVLGPDDRITLQILGRLASAMQYQGQLAEAEPLFRERVERSRRALGDDDRDTIGATGDLVYVLQQLGRVREAEPLARVSMEHSRRVLGDDAPEALIATNELAFLLLGEHRFAEAEPLFKASLEGHRRLRGRDHPDTLILVGNMAGLYAEQKRWSEAEPYDREAYEGFVRTLGADHQYSIQVESNLAVVLDNDGKTAEAVKLHRDAWQRARRVFGPTGTLTMRCVLKWSKGLVQRSEFTQAQPLLTETEAAMRQDAHANPSDHANLLTRIAQVRLGLRQYAAAEAALIEADRLRPDGDRKTPSGMETGSTFAQLYEAWEKAEPGRHTAEVAQWSSVVAGKEVTATKGVK